MSDLSPNDRLLFRYLLGQVSEEERAHVEERFISDHEYYGQLLLIEDELRCAYAKGSLTPADRDQFENRFLIFPDERKRVGLARAMIGELSSISVETARQPAVARRSERTGWQALLDRLGFGAPAFRFAMAAAAIFVLVSAAWHAFEGSRLRNQVSQLEAERAAREQEIAQQSGEERSRVEQLNKELDEERNSRALLEQELARRREETPAGDQVRPAIISLLLSPGLVRGGGETKKLTVSKGSAEARLLLDLAEKSGYRSYQALILDAEGRQVWSRGGLRATQVRGRQFVVLRIPTSGLAEDDYEINLRGLTEAGQSERVGDYYFTVLRDKEKGER